MHSSYSSISSMLTKSHAIFSKVEVYYAGQMLSTLTGALRVLDGSVEVSYDSAVRRTARLTVVDPTGLLVASTSAAAGMAPYGAELKIYRGTALYPTDSPVWTPLGVFGLSSNDIDDDGVPVMSINAFDRARTISRNKFTRPYVIASGLNVVSAIKDLIAYVAPPGMTYTVSETSTSQVTSATVLDAGADPWEAATKLAQSIGYDVYWDVSGNLVIASNPLVATLPQSGWSLTEGKNSVILGATNSFDNETGYNGIVVYGENSTNSTIVRGEAWDADPASPTYYLGPYGQVAKIISSPYVTDTAAANAFATAELAKILGSVQTVSAACVPNPALDLHDVVPVQRSKSNLSLNMRAASFNVPLSSREAQQITFAELRSVA